MPTEKFNELMRLIRDDPDNLITAFFDEVKYYQRGQFDLLLVRPFFSKHARHTIKNELLGRSNDLSIKNRIYFYYLFNKIDDLRDFLLRTIEYIEQETTDGFKDNHILISLFLGSVIHDKGCNILTAHRTLRATFINNMVQRGYDDIVQTMAAIVPSAKNKLILKSEYVIGVQVEQELMKFNMTYRMNINEVEKDMIAKICANILSAHENKRKLSKLKLLIKNEDLKLHIRKHLKLT